MKSLDSALIAVVFIVWGSLALVYAMVPMLYMPPSIRVWGLGALLFLILAGVIAWGERRARRLHGAKE